MYDVLLFTPILYWVCVVLLILSHVIWVFPPKTRTTLTQTDLESHLCGYTCAYLITTALAIFNMELGGDWCQLLCLFLEYNHVLKISCLVGSVRKDYTKRFDVARCTTPQMVTCLPIVIIWNLLPQPPTSLALESAVNSVVLAYTWYI